MVTLRDAKIMLDNSQESLIYKQRKASNLSFGVAGATVEARCVSHHTSKFPWPYKFNGKKSWGPA